MSLFFQRIEVNEMINGIIYPHEHITIDLSKGKNDLDCKLDVKEETIRELNELKNMGVKKIIDVTNKGMGRNIRYVEDVAYKTNIEIYSSTGYYKEPFLPQEVYELNEKELSLIMIKEILFGIEDTGIRAKVIGEIGTSKDIILPMEEKVFKASVRAHIDTGAPIITHTTLGKLGLEQVKIFKEYGAQVEKIVISHVDLSGDLDYILKLIDNGVNVAFDTVGKINYQKDEKRIELIKNLCEQNLSNKILLSMDITRRSHLKYKGGIGYLYLLENFIPKLQQIGIKQEDIENMLVNNAERIFFS